MARRSLTYEQTKAKYVKRVRDFLADYYRATGRADIPLGRVRRFLHQSSADALEEAILATLKGDEVIEVVGEGGEAMICISHEWLAGLEGGR